MWNDQKACVQSPIYSRRHPAYACAQLHGVLDSTVFLHSCRFCSCPVGDSNERGRPASTVQYTAIVAPDQLLPHEKCVLLSDRTIAIERTEHSRKTALYCKRIFFCMSFVATRLCLQNQAFFGMRGAAAARLSMEASPAGLTVAAKQIMHEQMTPQH